MNFIADESPRFYLEKAKERFRQVIYDEVHLGLKIRKVEDSKTYTDFVLGYNDPYTTFGSYVIAYSPRGNAVLTKDEKNISYIKECWKNAIRRGTFLPVEIIIKEYDEELYVRLRYNKSIYYQAKAEQDVNNILEGKV